MICSICKKGETSVVDSRPTEDGTAIRRRRLCVCGARFTTFERVQFREIMVVKKNGRKSSFDRDKLSKSIYIALKKRPIDTETGNFVIELIVTSECGSTSDSMLVAIEPHFSIEGRLWTSSNTAYDGTIVAYRKDNISTRAFLIETSQDDGNFRFPKVMRGGYYVYALPDTNSIDNLVPGYYAHKRHWDQAHIINVDANVYDLDIFLSAVDYVLPEGEATISGNMVMPEKSNVNGELYCQPWLLGSNLEYCIGGLSNITVFLFDQTYSKLMDCSQVFRVVWKH